MIDNVKIVNENVGPVGFLVLIFPYSYSKKQDKNPPPL